MKFLNGITLLLLFQLVGEFASRYLKLPVPGPVLGMLLLFLVMSLRKQVPVSLDMASSALLSHLSLLFVPAGVGMMVHFNRIAEEWIPITVSLLLSTIITMLTTAVVMYWLVRLVSQKAENDE
ncbi:MAG: CidA/LrgA family protein [Chromatiales bacterium]|jgi:holin-like protein